MQWLTQGWNTLLFQWIRSLSAQDTKYETRRKGFQISTNIFLQNEVSLESVQVSSDPDIETISPTKRGCLFSHEQPDNYTLTAHNKYTQVKHCAMEDFHWTPQLKLRNSTNLLWPMHENKFLQSEGNYRVRRLLVDLNSVGDRYHILQRSQNATAFAQQKM